MFKSFLKKILYFLYGVFLVSAFIFFVLLIDGHINFELPVKTVYTTYNGKEYIKKTSKRVPSKVKSQFNEIVVFNTNSNIYHEPWCEWSEKCVDNCVYMEREEAQKYGRHCHVCVIYLKDEDEHDNSKDYEDYMNNGVPDRFE